MIEFPVRHAAVPSLRFWQVQALDLARQHAETLMQLASVEVAAEVARNQPEAVERRRDVAAEASVLASATIAEATERMHAAEQRAEALECEMAARTQLAENFRTMLAAVLGISAADAPAVDLLAAAHAYLERRNVQPAQETEVLTKTYVLQVPAEEQAPPKPAPATVYEAGRWTKTCRVCKQVFSTTIRNAVACSSCKAPERTVQDNTPLVKQREEIACVSCKHGKRNDQSDSGWECKAECFRDCLPWTYAKKHEPKEAK